MYQCQRVSDTQLMFVPKTHSMTGQITELEHIHLQYMYLQELGSIVARVLINQSIRACDLGKLLLLGVSTIYLLQLLFDNFYKSAFCAFQALIIYVITCMYTEDKKFHLKFICQHSHRVLLSTWRIYKLVLFQQTD